MARGEVAWSLQLAVRSGELVPELVNILGQVTRTNLQAKPLIPIANCPPHTDIAAKTSIIVSSVLSPAKVHLL